MFRLSEIIYEYPLINIITIVFLIAALLSVLVAFFPRKNLKDEIEEVNVEEKMSKKHLMIIFISACLIMPFFETLVFQFSVIRLIQIFFKDVNEMLLVSLTVSTLLFSLAHLIGREFFDVLTRIPLGIALALVFLICDLRDYHPIVITYLFHFMWNVVFALVLPILAKGIDKKLSTD